MKKYVDSAGAIIDIDGLPSDLVAQLSCARDPLEETIIGLFSDGRDRLSLDQILVLLYREHRILKKRRFLQNKLYRMPEIDTEPDRKGIYTLHPAFREDA